jgi:hypothetical protein
MNMKLDNIIIGILLGLLLPVGFLWFYLFNFKPEIPFFEALQMLWGTVVFGQLMLLAIVPNLASFFFIYKKDAFKLGMGVGISTAIYFLGSLISMLIF